MLPIPKYRELEVKPIWEHVKEVEELAKYFPTLKDNELPDRAFLWGILGTIAKRSMTKVNRWGQKSKRKELLGEYRRFNRNTSWFLGQDYEGTNII